MAHQFIIYLFLVGGILCFSSHSISGLRVRAAGGKTNADDSLDISDDFPEEVIKTCAQKCDHCYDSSDTLSRLGCFEKCEDEGPEAFTCSINGWCFFFLSNPLFFSFLKSAKVLDQIVQGSAHTIRTKSSISEQFYQILKQVFIEI